MLEHEPGFNEYAQRVINERCPTARKSLIDECPKEWRDDVIARLAAYHRQAARDYASRPSHPRQETRAVKHVRGNPVVAARSLADLRATLKPAKEVRQ